MEQTFEAFVAEQFAGKLHVGCHSEDSGKACVFEAWNAYQKKARLGSLWTDSTIVTGTWDFRSLNDIPVSTKLRALWMVRLAEAYAGSRRWPTRRKVAVLERIFVRTVQEMLQQQPTPLQAKVQDAYDYEPNLKRALEAVARRNWKEEWQRIAFDHGACVLDAWAALTSGLTFKVVEEATIPAPKTQRARRRRQLFVKACAIWLDAAEAVA